MNFKESIDFIYRFKDWERGDRYKFGLSTFAKFLEKVGNPHTKLKRPILIGGTKGKGSTANILASILRKSGKTGLFTSPHFIDIRERIRINNRTIPVDAFVRIVEKIKPYIMHPVRKELSNGVQELSTFEILTAMALIYFAEEDTDFSVFEVGLGGRLDATNILSPEISVLTTISFDHTEILGNTLFDIANEKCGIIREKRNVVCSPQAPEAMVAIKKVCESRNAKLWTIGEDFFCSDPRCGFDGVRFKIGKEEYFTPLLGRHQIINSLLAIYVAQLLGIPSVFIKQGIREVKIHGRLEIIRRDPTVIYDTAHNVASAWVLRRAINELFDFRHLIVIFGVLKDKDKEGMIKAFAGITDYAYVVPVKSERSADSYELLEIFKRAGVKSQRVESAEIAMKMALEKAGPNDLVLATGSSYIVGELLKSGILE